MASIITYFTGDFKENYIFLLSSTKTISVGWQLVFDIKFNVGVQGIKSKLVA